MKKLFITATFVLFVLLSFSKTYGTIQYMGKTFEIESAFFQSLNAEYNAKGLNQKYQKIYFATVDLLKENSTVIIVDEAKRMSWDSIIIYQYNSNGKASKSDKARAGYIIHNVLLPVIERYASYN